VFKLRICMAVLALLHGVDVFADGYPPPPAAPGAALTLHEAVRRTLASSPDLARLPYRLRTQAARIEAAGQRPPPELSLQLENVLGSGRSRGFDGAEATFALSQIIELGDQRQLRTEVARRSGEVLEMQARIEQLDVLAEVGRRFIHVAADEKQLALTTTATRLSEQTVAEAERRLASARSPAVELHRARIALSRASVEQEHAEHELLSSRRKLAAMWGARVVDFGSVRAELFTLPAVGDYAQLLQRLSTSPDFLHFATDARQRDAEIRLAEARLRAPLTLSLGIRRLQQTADTAAVAGLSLPLFASRRAAPGIAEARAQRALVDAEAEAAQVRAEAGLFELVQELRHAITEAEVLRNEVLPQMLAALDATAAAWRRGRYSYLEWTEAQRERIDVERALIRAAANAHLLQVEIERLTGEPATPSSMPRRQRDHGHAGETQSDASPVGPDRTYAVDEPQPQQGRADVDAAVSGIDAPAGLRMQAQQPDEQREAQRRRQQQPRAASVPEPQPRQIAAEDLGQRRESEQPEGLDAFHNGSSR
jgi:outer membrane protein, heavy metal efflux system